MEGGGRRWKADLREEEGAICELFGKRRACPRSAGLVGILQPLEHRGGEDVLEELLAALYLLRDALHPILLINQQLSVIAQVLPSSSVVHDAEEMRDEDVDPHSDIGDVVDRADLITVGVLEGGFEIWELVEGVLCEDI